MLKYLIVLVVVAMSFLLGYRSGRSTQYADMKSRLGIKEILFQTRFSDNKTYVMYVTRENEEIVVDY
jgi:hypothetical protein